MNESETFRIACAVCGNTAFKNPFGKKHFLVRCKKCGMVSARFIPSPEELKSYYYDYPSYEKISALTLQRYNEILDKLEPYRKSNKLLETGCGFGFFLEAARKRNWDVTGTELSENALLACKKKNLPVVENLHSLLGESSGSFDAIVSLEVLEHINDPVKEIDTYASLLRPEGALYITTPNFNSISRHLLGRRWNVIEYPEHLHYFTPGTINRLLENKFIRVSNQTLGVSPARIYYSIRNKNNPIRAGKGMENFNFNEFDRKLSDNIEKTILLRLLKKCVNFFLASFRSGDTLKILYKKKA